MHELGTVRNCYRNVAGIQDGQIPEEEIHGCVKTPVKVGDSNSDNVSHQSDYIHQREGYGMQNP